jgi:two-component system cell cycle sensor histidine kinase/response regulator CckA
VWGQPHGIRLRRRAARVRPSLTAFECLFRYGNSPDVILPEMVNVKDALARPASGAPESTIELLTAMVDAQHEVISLGDDLEMVMRFVSERSRALTGADTGIVAIAGDGGLIVRAAAGPTSTRVGSRVDASARLCGRCLLEGRALVCTDTELDERVDVETCRRLNVRSIVVVPLLQAGETVGVLQVSSSRPGTFGAREIELLDMMAGFVSAALVHAGARDALRTQEEELRLTFDIAPIGMAIVGLDGRLMRVNAALCRMLGYSAETLSTMRFREFTKPEDVERDVAQFERLVRGEIESYTLSKRYVRRDGGITHAELHASMARGSSGEPRHCVSAIEDVTERKRTEARLALADRMTSAGTLAAGVAHEINNPLTYVHSNLELLADHIRDVAAGKTDLDVIEASALLEDSREGARRVRTIVRQLRTFSRADAARREPIDLVPVIELAANMVSNEIRHRARLVRNIRAAPLVLGDEGRLSQVVINLLVNAAHSIVEGNANRNEIRVELFTDEGGRAVVEVSDTGRGIDHEAQSRIFDPFFTTKPIGVGTGLGLSICHEIITQHGGEIWVESTGPRGTAFRVALPAALRAAARESTPETKPSVPPPSPRSRGRVLVVDDDALAARAMVRVLSQDHDVIDVRSGRAALALLTSDEAFDAIFCDLMMPEMTGMDLHGELVERGFDVGRMVFMTGGAFTPGARAFVERLSSACVEKPFEPQSLLALARDLVA